MTDGNKSRFNYGIFSFRTGNIYTTKMLLQWVRLAFEHEPPAGTDEYWERDGRYFDPLRPLIEPCGFASLEDAKASRRAACQSIADGLRNTDIFVFTLGLPESWRHRETGLKYAACPGTLVGTFDPALHNFFTDQARLMRAKTHLKTHGKASICRTL